MEFSQEALLIESWTFFALGVLVVIARMISRRIKLGSWRALGIEDYLMIFALVNLAGVCFSINEVAANGSSYLPPEDVATLTEEGRKKAIYGSIMTFVLEIFTITGLWTIKTCLLLLYARITKGGLVREYFVVKCVGAFRLVSYLLVMLLFLFYWCHPTYEYWAVPYTQDQCATYYHHLIFATAFNILTDLMLFFIPIPIIVRTSMPLKRKLILCFILGLGVFNILASILNRYYNFTYDYSYVFLYWYVAELGVAMFVGNLPLCYPILRLALGKGREPSSNHTPPYIITIGSERMRRRRAVDDTVLQTTQWDKLDDRDVGTADGCGANSLMASDGGSNFELALQGRKNHRYETTVSSSSRNGESSQRSPNLSHDDNHSEKIVVMRTVDVSVTRSENRD